MVLRLEQRGAEAFSGTWTDPQSRSTYNDSSGWDYSGEYFRWEGSQELIC